MASRVQIAKSILYFMFICVLWQSASSMQYVGPNLNYSYPQTKYFTQKMDHFNPTIDSTYEQRYLISQEYWNKDGGPIFFYTGNEGDITLFVNNTGFIWDIAPQFGAMVVFAEHRYYGKSKPFPDLSPNPDNVHKFGQFTVEQALADYARLITYLKETIDGAKYSHVIAFGGSYGGMLAAWIRQKYPHIVTGSLAASAPVRYFPGLVGCAEYNELVTLDFENVPGGRECTVNIRNSWKTIESVAKQPDGFETLTKVFHLCKSLKDVSSLEDWLSNAWSSLAMVNYPYPTNFLNPLPAWPIQETCKPLSKPKLQGIELLNQVREAAGVFYNYSGQSDCFSLDSEASPGLSAGLWYYQTCTEMVMPFCADGFNDMFKPAKWTIEDFTKECQKKFGTTPRPVWPILQFGGRDWSQESNIIFSNGKLDPWSVGGILESQNEKILILSIANAAHHLDLRHKNDLDPKSVQIARHQEMETIANWLRQ
uniref:lysosomal Pro-X carboxypeptidase-like n=1 Tax=Styela clava TaxID=7725 RepID=UPI00193ACECA|nr:lysosomal Pro-X carboxypeptidase-like [Styela clava]